MAAGKPSRVHRQYKAKCRIRNWREHEHGLRSRGDATIWLSESAIAVLPPRFPRSSPPAVSQDFRYVRSHLNRRPPTSFQPPKQPLSETSPLPETV